MISTNLEKLINNQVNFEFHSAYLYLAMSSYFEKLGFKGISSWYMVQYKEETDHAMYFYKYLQNVNGEVILKAIEEPDRDFKSIMDVFERTLEHERKVTALINNIAIAARDEGDFKTSQLLLWFVQEQVEEESNAEDNITRLKIAGDNGLFLLDQELAARIYAPGVNPPVKL